jgi:hypothetical protein
MNARQRTMPVDSIKTVRKVLKYTVIQMSEENNVREQSFI